MQNNRREENRQNCTVEYLTKETKLSFKMNFSPTGVIAYFLWHDLPNHSPRIKLGEFVVMPNHIHRILILNKPDEVMNNGTTDEKQLGNGNDFANDHGNNKINLIQ